MLLITMVCIWWRAKIMSKGGESNREEHHITRTP